MIKKILYVLLFYYDNGCVNCIVIVSLCKAEIQDTPLFFC